MRLHNKNVRIVRSLLLQIIIMAAFFAGTDASAFTASRVSFTVTMGTQALTIPWYVNPLFKRVNPAFSVGAAYPLKRWKYIDLYQSVNTGFLQHYWWMSALYLDTESGTRFTAPFGFYADVNAGLGYMHYFLRRETMVLKNGSYVREPDRGMPSIIVPMSLSLGYSGKPDQQPLFAPFLSIRWILQGMFLEEIPAMSHMLLMAGVRIQFPETRADHHE